MSPAVGASATHSRTAPQPISRSGFAIVVPTLFFGNYAVAGASHIRAWVAERAEAGQPIDSPSSLARPGTVVHGSMHDLWPGPNFLGNSQRVGSARDKECHACDERSCPGRHAARLHNRNRKLATVSASASRLVSMIPAVKGEAFRPLVGVSCVSGSLPARWLAAASWA